MKVMFTNRLSPWQRGEDEGEGFEQMRRGSALTLPLSLKNGEATQQPRGCSKAFSQT